MPKGTTATVEAQVRLGLPVSSGDTLTHRQVEKMAKAALDKALADLGADVREVTFHIEAHEGLKASQPKYRDPTPTELNRGVFEPGDQVLEQAPQLQDR